MIEPRHRQLTPEQRRAAATPQPHATALPAPAPLPPLDQAGQGELRRLLEVPLAEILDQQPGEDLDDPAWSAEPPDRRRDRLVDLGQRLASGASNGAALGELVADAQRELRRLLLPVAANETASWAARCLTIDPSWLTDPPPPRRWLLLRPTRDGKPCSLGSGDGVLPLGEVGLFVSDGGAGKSLSLIALAVCVITGRDWFGHFHVPFAARDGRVLLLLAEEPAEEIRRRLHTVASNLGLDERERARVVAQLRIVARDHAPPGLLAGGKDLVELQQWLTAEAGSQGWSLVGLDVYARLAPAEAELDQIVATATLTAAESLTRVPGGPTVLVLHHASLSAVKTGEIRARGVTGIRNAARWEGTLRPEGEDVWFTQSKSNVSPPMREELRLVRGPGGMLRAASEAEEQEREQRQADAKDTRRTDKDARREERIVRLEGEILAALAAAATPPTSQKGIAALVKGDTNEKQDAVARLLAAGRIRNEGKERTPYRVVDHGE